ncbi:MFS transporter [Roseomonas sp. M0104]|uniref:MFS transporter n=1 Tax=Teichococcus coralli TaxID=2545983 RepID=A0A845BHC7_9PROT|nr:MFS transporter [Pseudoroseomonas coralli]MXP65464.1 MFS transporter [Pseudoroseomonas coralli]
MSDQTLPDAAALPSSSPVLGAVLAMTLCAAALIASEFMPVSLLTPLASDLGMTEGQAGQVISVSGIFAVLTSLLVSSAAGRLDRRTVLLGLTLLMVVSGVVVAFAPNFGVLMAGRALLGVSIGGFWSMSTATVMRLVPPDAVPRALAVLNGGNALAATVAAPLGSFLGAWVGWRGAFLCVVPLAALAFAWQLATVPPLPAERQAGTGATLGLLGRPQVASGMLAILFLFMGQFALFTYLRPFLEAVTRVDVSTLSLILLGLGITGLVGTSLVGRLLRASLHGTLIAIPLAMAAIAIALVAFDQQPLATAALLAGWGLIATPAPVGWGTWLSRTLPAEAEAGGGLMVATIQLAITAGASAGGLLFDAGGHESAFGASATMLGASALLAILNWRLGAARRRSFQAPAPPRSARPALDHQ